VDAPHQHPRARAVPDAPAKALLARTENLARGWAVALITALPLEQIGEIRLEELASEAPKLLGRTVRALVSDAELEQLEAGRLVAIAGARDPASAVRAVEALRGVLWEALLEELRAPNVREVGDMSDRLAYVCSELAAAAVQEPGSPPAPTPPDVYASSTPEAPALTSEPSSVAAPEAPRIEIRDVRHEEDPAAWIGSIGRRLERHAEDRLPFGVLLIELTDLERLEQAEPAQELMRLVDRVEGAIGEELRPADVLTRERPGRYWLVTPETDGIGARMLAERLAGAVRRAASHRGAPLEVAIGIAVCPEDGREAPGLAVRADIGVYAARAAGQAIAPADDPV